MTTPATPTEAPRTDLREWVRHKIMCPAPIIGGDCTCGLDAALASSQLERDDATSHGAER